MSGFSSADRWILREEVHNNMQPVSNLFLHKSFIL